MKRNITQPQTRLYLIGATILLFGLGSAIPMHLTAAKVSDSGLGYEPENSRKVP